jgi:dihydroorotate dehydrogenase
MSIELAPDNKQGLSLASPLIAGSGAVGLGDAWPAPVDAAASGPAALGPNVFGATIFGAAVFGAIILSPISVAPRRGLAGPRLAELPAGFLLTTGGQNPGYRRAVGEHGRNWQRLGVPVLAALDGLDEAGGQSMGDWVRLAELWEEGGLVAGLELALPEDAQPRLARDVLNAVRRATTLPLLAKLPVGQAAALAEACLQGGADALVVGVAPRAAYPAAEGPLVEGTVAGPIAFPFTLCALRRVSALRLDAPLVAAGGIQTHEQVRMCQELGAVAVQIRSLLWTDPLAVARLAEALAG